MTQPLISIVLCTYNGERFIKEQLDSLLAQQYPNLEIIISDDASTDATPSILAGYQDHPSVKLFLQEQNLGPVGNFGFATAKTTGAFIAFSDQDDRWLPDKVNQLYQSIGDSWLVYSDSALIDETGKSLHKKLSDLRHMYTGNETIGFVLANVVWGHAMMISRRLLDYALPIPEKIPHDIWMGFKAATLTGIRYLDIPLTLYRQHAATYTTTIPGKIESRTMTKRYSDFLDKLHWIGVMRDHERPEKKEFYSRLYDLYALKSQGRYVWRLFFFMLRHRKGFFMFRRKKWISQVIELLKQARGESAY